MRVLMMSMEGDGLGIAHQLVKDGNDVDLFIKNTKFRGVGEGIVNRVASWRPFVSKADLIVGDMVGFGSLEETLKRMGTPMLGISAIADSIELDRERGMQLFQKAGISVPDSSSFRNPKDAEVVAERWKAPGYVIKPDGNIETGKTYVCRDEETFEWALTQYDKGQQLVVQEIIEGVEVSTEGWFNGRDWIKPFNHTYEEKRLFDRGKGPNTGCQGNIVIATDGDNIVEQVLLPLTPFLRGIGYRGPFDVNAIVTKERVYALEPTPRFGYDAVEAMMEGLAEPMLDVLFETALGVKKTMALRDDPLIAVRVSLPPWPGGEPERSERGRPIVGLNKENLRHIFLTDAYKDGDDYRFAASDGVLMKVTAHGPDIDSARRRVYRTIDNMGTLDQQCRSDIGKRVKGDIAQLNEWGML